MSTQASDRADLYGLPLERFVSARAELARTMRKEHQHEAAAEIAALRKPSVAAWAVNQLVRTQKREIGALFAAGDELQSTQSQLLAGKGDPRSLREAVARERDAVDALSGKARGLLSAQGHELTQTTLDRVSETLHAAALDGDARAQVQQGCLQRELRHIGLGGEIGDASAPATRGPSRSPKRKDSASAKPSTADTAQARAEARRARQESARRAKDARAAEAGARRAADRAQRDLRAATARRDDAVRSLDEAQADLAAAAKAAEHATAEHRRAQEALEGLQCL